MTKLDLINLLEIFSQWEAFARAHNSKISTEAENLKIKLEKEILMLGAQ